MVELPELNDEQRLYLKTVFDYFHVEGKWPTYLWVETTILQTYPEKRSEFDLAEMCKSLPDNFASAFYFNHQYGQEAAFIAPVLYYFPEAKEEMADFIRAVRFCVEKINASIEERPEITSEDLRSQLHMQPLAIRKMGLLLQYEPAIHNGSSSNASEGWWQIGLLRGKSGVRLFDGVETFEQYLEKRTALTGIFSGYAAMKQLQSEPASIVPAVDMDTGGTQYHNSHIVQGDYYNISGNAGEVKIKSPSSKEVVIAKNEHKNPWVSGSFYLIVFIVVIVALSVVAHILPISVLPVVIIGGLIALAAIGGLQLRQDDKLSEENFLKLMILTFKYLPWLWGKDANSSKIDATSLPDESVEKQLEKTGQTMSNETTPKPSNIEVAGTTITLVTTQVPKRPVKVDHGRQQ